MTVGRRRWLRASLADLDNLEDQIRLAVEAAQTSADTAGAAAALPTKRVTMSLGAPRNKGAAGALSAWAERIPITLPVATKRWRLRVGNRHLGNTDAAALTSVFTIGPVFIGLPSETLASSGRRTGAWAAAPTQVSSGGATPADGTDWVSGWVTDPALQFQPNTTKMVATSLTAPDTSGNGSSTTSSHYGFRSTAAGANGVVASQLAATNYFGNTLALDKRIEYEFEGKNPIGLYIGASGDEGYNLTTTLAGGGGYEHLTADESWPGAMGLRLGVPWVNASIVGATQAPFMSASSLAYTRFDLTTTVPDFAVVGLGGNSVLSGTGVIATIQTEVLQAIAAVRSFGIKKIYLQTIPPAALASGGATETLRQTYNTWVRNKPGNITGVIDIDLILRTSSAAPTTQDAGYVTADNIHPTHGGYQRWASGIHLR